MGAREAERYSEVANKCSFTGQGSGFAYHPSFTVGETLYQVRMYIQYNSVGFAAILDEPQGDRMCCRLAMTEGPSLPVDVALSQASTSRVILKTEQSLPRTNISRFLR